MVYRATDMSEKIAKSKMLRLKKLKLMYCNHWALYGKLWRRMETMPVPMLTANHLVPKRHGQYSLHSSLQHVVVQMSTVTTEDGNNSRRRKVANDASPSPFLQLPRSLLAWRLFQR
jgi:hypothetical protein